MLNSILTQTMTIETLALCTAVSFVLGIIGAFIYMYRNTYNKNFVVTLALLPAIVQLVIMMVNGNIGTGVAVMGAFSLVRFRSVPGGAKDICAIFLAMAIGLATGMGYIGAAAIFSVMYAAVNVILNIVPFGEGSCSERELKITIPESLDYNGVFDDLLGEYTRKSTLTRVKTTNMGSLYELKYEINLKEDSSVKRMIDEIRCRNGNLTVVCGQKQLSQQDQL